MISDKAERIRQAALKCFAREGFYGVTMPEVARMAEVAVGTLYHYFPSKAELANDLFRCLSAQLAEKLWSDEDPNPDVLQKYWTFWRRLATYAWEHPAAFHYLDLAFHGDYLSQESRACSEAIRGPAKRLFQQGLDKGLFKPLPSSLGFALIFGSLGTLSEAALQGRIRWTADLVTLAGQCCLDALSKPAHS